jgi:hypothetical protein
MLREHDECHGVPAEGVRVVPQGISPDGSARGRLVDHPGLPARDAGKLDCHVAVGLVDKQDLQFVPAPDPECVELVGYDAAGDRNQLAPRSHFFQHHLEDTVPGVRQAGVPVDHADGRVLARVSDQLALAYDVDPLQGEVGEDVGIDRA